MTSVYSASVAVAPPGYPSNAVTVAQVRQSKERSLAVLRAREKERKFQLDSHFENCKRKIELTADLELAALETENFQQLDQKKAALEQQLKQTITTTEYGAAESVLNLEYTALSLKLHAKISALERRKARMMKETAIDWEIIAPVGPVHVALQQAQLQQTARQMNLNKQ